MTVKQYLLKGEFWENNPVAYVSAFRLRREIFVAALEAVDLAEMVSTWSDETLFDVAEAGSDLAFNKTQRVAIGKAVTAERAKRSGSAVPTGNGMAEDGGQLVAPEVSEVVSA